MDFSLFSISIRARDVKKLAAFYKETFGFKTKQENAGIVVLELNAGLFLVFQKLGVSTDKAEKPKAADDKAPTTQPQAGPSRYGVAFEVDDIDEAYKKLKAKLAINEPPTREDWGARTVSGRDPEGNRIDLIQRIKAASAS